MSLTVSLEEEVWEKLGVLFFELKATVRGLGLKVVGQLNRHVLHKA